MFEIFISSFIATFFYTPYGYLFQKGNNIRSLSLQLIFGLILLSFFSLIINFFSPLDNVICTIFLIIGLFIIIKLKKVYLKKKYLIFCLLSSIILFLLITNSNVYRPDAGLYHLPYIGILNNEKIIIGLSNLHFRFGHISILQYTSGIFNNIIFDERGINLAICLVVSSVILNFLSNFNYRLRKRNFDFYFFLIFSLIIFIFYKVNRFSEYGNDAPAHLLMFILVSEIIKNFNNINNYNFSNFFLLAAYIFMSKIILLLCFLFPLTILLNKKFSFNFFYIKNIFILIFIILWTLKNILVSGCILYPIKSTCFTNTSWTNLDKAKEVSIENEAWAKGWPDLNKKKSNLSIEDYSKNFNWVLTWGQNHFLKILSIMVPYLTALAIIILFIKSKTKIFKLEKYFKYIIFINFLGILMWFLKVPVFRYGYSYLVLFISLFFAYFASIIILKERSIFLFKGSIILLIFIFSLKNLNRIAFNEEKYFDYPWPKIYSMSMDNILKKPSSKIINGKKFYYTFSGYCMYGNSPCGQSIDGLKHKKSLSYSILYK